jgi:Uma2 family endonuclease
MSATVRTTYEEFDEMIRRGDFADTENRLELLFGEICIMPLPEPPHESAVDELAEWSFRSLPPGTARVRIQNSLGIPALDSVTLPDIAWMRRRDYSAQRPLPEDVLLIIEVSDTTLSIDRGKKAKLYAQAGIAEYWILNLPKRCLEIRRDPEGEVYRTVQILHPGDEARPMAFPEVALPLAQLFPP